MSDSTSSSVNPNPNPTNNKGKGKRRRNNRRKGKKGKAEEQATNSLSLSSSPSPSPSLSQPQPHFQPLKHSKNSTVTRSADVEFDGKDVEEEREETKKGTGLISLSQPLAGRKGERENGKGNKKREKSKRNGKKGKRENETPSGDAISDLFRRTTEMEIGDEEEEREREREREEEKRERKKKGKKGKKRNQRKREEEGEEQNMKNSLSLLLSPSPSSSNQLTSSLSLSLSPSPSPSASTAKPRDKRLANLSPHEALYIRAKQLSAELKGSGPSLSPSPSSSSSPSPSLSLSLSNTSKYERERELYDTIRRILSLSPTFSVRKDLVRLLWGHVYGTLKQGMRQLSEARKREEATKEIAEKEKLSLSLSSSLSLFRQCVSDVEAALVENETAKHREKSLSAMVLSIFDDEEEELKRENESEREREREKESGSGTEKSTSASLSLSSPHSDSNEKERSCISLLLSQLYGCIGDILRYQSVSLSLSLSPEDSLSEIVSTYEHALSLSPSHGKHHNSLGVTYQSTKSHSVVHLFRSAYHYCRAHTSLSPFKGAEENMDAILQRALSLFPAKAVVSLLSPEVSVSEYKDNLVQSNETSNYNSNSSSQSRRQAHGSKKNRRDTNIEPLDSASSLSLVSPPPPTLSSLSSPSSSSSSIAPSSSLSLSPDLSSLSSLDIFLLQSLHIISSLRTRINIDLFPSFLSSWRINFTHLLETGKFSSVILSELLCLSLSTLTSIPAVDEPLPAAVFENSIGSLNRPLNFLNEKGLIFLFEIFNPILRSASSYISSFPFSFPIFQLVCWLRTHPRALYFDDSLCEQFRSSLSLLVNSVLLEERVGREREREGTRYQLSNLKRRLHGGNTQFCRTKDWRDAVKYPLSGEEERNRETEISLSLSHALSSSSPSSSSSSSSSSLSLSLFLPISSQLIAIRRAANLFHLGVNPLRILVFPRPRDVAVEGTGELTDSDLLSLRSRRLEEDRKRESDQSKSKSNSLSLSPSSSSSLSLSPDPLSGYNTSTQTVVVLDAPNIAMSCGDNKRFVCGGLQTAISFFQRRGYKVVAIGPSYLLDYSQVGERKRMEKIGIGSVKASKLPDNVTLLNSLKEDGIFYPTPPFDYDDSYTIKYAMKHDAVVVSTDKYRDHIELYEGFERKREVREWLRTHVLSFFFAGDEFLPNPDFKLPPPVRS